MAAESVPSTQHPESPSPMGPVLQGAFLHQSLPTPPPSWSLIHPLLSIPTATALLLPSSSPTWTRATAFWQSFLLWHATTPPPHPLSPKSTLRSAHQTTELPSQDPSVAHGLHSSIPDSPGRHTAPCRSAAAASTLYFPPLSSNCLQIPLTLHTGSPSPGLC